MSLEVFRAAFRSLLAHRQSNRLQISLFTYLGKEVRQKLFVVCEFAAVHSLIKRIRCISDEFTGNSLAYGLSQGVTLVKKLEKTVLTLGATFSENYIASFVV